MQTTRQSRVEVGHEVTSRGSRQRANHDVDRKGCAGQPFGCEVSKATLHPVACDRFPHCLGNDEAGSRGVGRRSAGMQHQASASAADALPHGVAELTGSAQSRLRTQHQSAQPARRTRPRRRRAEMMARPARVRIRRRKPWVRLRRRLLGWKVRLLTRMLHCSMVFVPMRPIRTHECHRGDWLTIRGAPRLRQTDNPDQAKSSRHADMVQDDVPDGLPTTPDPDKLL